jgi:hypothetical protein
MQQNFMFNTMIELNADLQVNSAEPMEEPKRSELGKQAYWDFIKGLKAIQQLEVFLHAHPGQQMKSAIHFRFCCACCARQTHVV